MRIVIETTPHDLQRYETVGDWYETPDGTLHIRVSDMKDKHYEFLVAMHELIEAWLCKQRGITDAEVTAFDVAFESARARGEYADDAEPGAHPDAPYHDEHFFATNIERMLAYEMGIDWEAYDKMVMSL